MPRYEPISIICAAIRSLVDEALAGVNLGALRAVLPLVNRELDKYLQALDGDAHAQAKVRAGIAPHLVHIVSTLGVAVPCERPCCASPGVTWLVAQHARECAETPAMSQGMVDELRSIENDAHAAVLAEARAIEAAAREGYVDGGSA